MAHPTAISGNMLLNIDFKFLFYLENFVNFAIICLRILFLLRDGFKIWKFLGKCPRERRRLIFFGQSDLGVEDQEVVEMENATF